MQPEDLRASIRPSPQPAKKPSVARMVLRMKSSPRVSRPSSLLPLTSSLGSLAFLPAPSPLLLSRPLTCQSCLCLRAFALASSQSSLSPDMPMPKLLRVPQISTPVSLPQRGPPRPLEVKVVTPPHPVVSFYLITLIGRVSGREWEGSLESPERWGWVGGGWKCSLRLKGSNYPAFLWTRKSRPHTDGQGPEQTGFRSTSLVQRTPWAQQRAQQWAQHSLRNPRLCPWQAFVPSLIAGRTPNDLFLGSQTQVPAEARQAS